MKVNIVGSKNSIFNQFMAEVRDAEIQKDRMRFRRNLERLGEIFAYEISKELEWQNREVITPLGVAQVPVLKEQPVLATVLRAGLPFHNGLLNYFDHAENAFISAYRRHHKDGSFDIQLEYVSTPDLSGKELIICDPMLASGASLALAYKSLLKHGKPKHTHVVAVVSHEEGINHLRQNLQSDTTIWVGAVDEELTAHAYIVPGLGDAGDLAYGEKM